MTILIADSGSTKTTWMMAEVDKGTPTVLRPCQTMGLNPLYTKPQQISGALDEVLNAVGIRDIDALYFYGAGCSGERIAMVEKALAHVLPPHTHIEVASDLLGACRALGTEICCIMGTGSIAALYDAETGYMGTACALGYILGDEGSGAYFGRRVLSDYLKDQMPQKARAAFEEEFGEITAESAIVHVYQGQFPNRYLASFAPFIGRHLDRRYCYQIAFDGVEAFFKRNIMRLQPEPTDRISFVGSVAFHLQDVIRQVASLHGLQVGTFLQEPIEGLVEYHKKDK